MVSKFQMAINIYKGNSQKKVTKSNKNLTFKLKKKTTYFYPESIVYPFVNFYEKNGNYIIANTDYYEILTYVEHFGMSKL